jgi:hypothetical protein
MYSETGDWLFADNSDIMDGWDLPAVTATGARYGADPSDLHGCLFFYIREQYIGFAQRLVLFKIKIHLFAQPVASVGEMFSAGIRKDIVGSGFDRIELSNSADENYDGLAVILGSFGPLLSKENRHATIIISIINWIMVQAEADLNRAGHAVQMNAYRRAERYVRWHIHVFFLDVLIIELTSPHLALQKNAAGTMGNRDTESVYVSRVLNAFYDTDGPFRKYLTSIKATDSARSAGVRAKKKHTIVPHVRLAQ